MKKRKRAEPPPRNAFPDVVTKGLVSEDEARSLYNTSVPSSSLSSSCPQVLISFVFKASSLAPTSSSRFSTLPTIPWSRCENERLLVRPSPALPVSFVSLWPDTLLLHVRLQPLTACSLSLPRSEPAQVPLDLPFKNASRKRKGSLVRRCSDL